MKDVNDDMLGVNKVGEDGVHKSLKGSGGVTEAEGHDKGFK